MTRPRPALGYPSRSCACRALRSAGLSNDEIVARFAGAGGHITRAQINALLHHQRVRAAQLRVADVVIERLAPAAAERGISPVELAEELLAVIARDGLVDSVLDDRDARVIHKEG